MRKREIIMIFFCAFLLLALYLSITLRVWGLSLFGDEIDYIRFGNWSDAISGIGTTTALLIASIGVWIQHSTNKKRLVEEETSLFLWLESEEVKEEQKLIGITWILKIQNSTKSPIYNWLVKFDLNLGHICSISKRPILPDENIFNVPFLDNIEPNNTPTAIIIFESKSNRFWSRTIKGKLQMVSPKEILCTHSINN